MIRLGRPSTSRVDSIERSCRELVVTYREIGATANDRLPPGYRHDRASVPIGQGAEVFERGRDALRAWAAHAGIGATVTPRHAPVEPGVTVVVTVPLGPVTVVAPCRIVAVIDTDDAFGFAYGTLPGHPEQGEESFTVRKGTEGNVNFEIVAFSRPSDPLVRIAGPLSRLIQRRATTGYLEGVRRFVDSHQSGQ